MAGALYLVPCGLGGGNVRGLLPPVTLEVVHRLECFIVERPRSARAFLKAAGHPRALQDLRIDTLDEHTPETRLRALLAPIEGGSDCGLLSEAGCPAIADPGAELVRCAHSAGIRVVPLIGPSSILLALMSSGMCGQRFAFHGYLPIDRTLRARRLAALESAAEEQQSTQLFIEAPYRNEALLDAILDVCRPDTLLCIATDLASAGETVRTLPVEAWRAQRPDLDRRPTVFLLYRIRGPAISKRLTKSLHKGTSYASRRTRF
jgi:16S rRNA (cytidine1402-2'-O)-methyltransferase